MPAATEIPEALAEATEHQPGARAALAAALGAPVHAYLLAGPPGSGKRRAARAFAAELLAQDDPDPNDARRRALADPSPHPDLVWLSPRGTQHLVDEVRERVITAAAYRPFEGARRVFVIEAADAMADESQNALLKTLEEPADFVHLLLISAEPELLLETVRSRCQMISFRPLTEEAVAAGLEARGLGEGPDERRTAARLAGGDPRRAEYLVERRRAASCEPWRRSARASRWTASWPMRPGAAWSPPLKPRERAPARKPSRASRPSRRSQARAVPPGAPRAKRRRRAGGPRAAPARRRSTPVSASSRRGFETWPRWPRARRSWS